MGIRMSQMLGYGLMLIRLLQTYVIWWREGAQGLPGMLDESGISDDEAHI